MDNNSQTYSSAGAGSSGGKRKPDRRLGFLLIPVLIIVLLCYNSYYTLKEDQYAVLTTFGIPSMVSEPGLKFKIPLIQKCTKVSKSVQSFPLGYRIGEDWSIEEESLMITYDYNFVNVDFFVEYRVTDPIKYLFRSSDPVEILKMICQSYIRDTIGLYPVDSVITTGKSEIQADIKEKITSRMEYEDIGIQLVNITIQDSEPPTREVQQAFTAVETAKQSADTAINNAKKYANEVMPAAQADADQIIKQAEAYREGRINEAVGQSARFTVLFDEYRKFPLVTKQRLFYEAMEDILPDLKVIIMQGDTAVQTTLPLDQFASIEIAEGD